MRTDDGVSAVGPGPLRRFWHSAVGFGLGKGAWLPWTLIGLLVLCVVAQLLVQYRLNIWNRDFFDALEKRNGAGIRHQTYLLPGLAACSIFLAAFAVWARMTFQRRWRGWLTAHLVGLWLENGNYRRLEAGSDEPQLAEYRIAEDARIATDAPIDLVTGLLSSVLTAATFVVVLWTVGGAIAIGPARLGLELPGYLVFASIAYAMLTTGIMLFAGRRMAHVIERKNQAESELKFAVTRLRAAPVGSAGAGTQAGSVSFALDEVLRTWRSLCGQHVRTTLVSSGNTLLAPIIGLILSVPKYIDGSLSLGEVTQAAAAFAAVQIAFNWLVDNYPRLAEWASSASRVGVLLLAVDQLGEPRRSAPTEPSSGR